MLRYRFMFLLAGVVGIAGVSQMATAQDKVEFKRDGKAATTSGQILEESVAGIKVKPTAGKEIMVSTTEIQKVTYEFPAALRPEINPVIALDEKKDAVKALDEYKKVTDKIKANANTSLFAKRYVEYRIAMLKASLGEKDAEGSLSAFLKANSNSWQYPHAARQLAGLQMNHGDLAGAAKTIEALGFSSGLPKELKQEADMMYIDIQFQAGKFDDIKGKIDTLLKTVPASDPQAKKLQIFQIGTTAKDGKIEDIAAKLQSIIDAATDPSIKALAANTLGDCYAMKNLKREAMWQYLWVDAVYNADPIERIKALDRLGKLYELEFKDPDRAKAFKEKAQRLRSS